MCRILFFPVIKAMLVLSLIATTGPVKAVDITHTQTTLTRPASLTDDLPASIRIFTAPGARVEASEAVTAALQAANVKVEIHAIDELARTEAELNASLPQDMQEAERVMKQRIADGMAMGQGIQQGWMNVLMVRQFQIHTVPAIVFDERQVVYGESDLGTAISYYQARKESAQ